MYRLLNVSLFTPRLECWVCFSGYMYTKRVSQFQRGLVCQMWDLSPERPYSFLLKQNSLPFGFHLLKDIAGQYIYFSSINQFRN